MKRRSSGHSLVALDWGRVCLLSSILMLSALGTGALAAGDSNSPWQLRSSALVDGSGIFFDQLLSNVSGRSDLRIRLAAPPAPGKSVTLAPAQIQSLLKEQNSGIAATNWTGARVVQVTRRMRALEDSEIKQMLAAALQRAVVKERGELELRLARPWLPVQVPDELLSLNILDLPSAGVTPNFIARFELRAGTDLVGVWQWPLQARVWREVWVAQTPLTRGDLWANADVARERRDVLALRETPASIEPGDPSLELAENILQGAPLFHRSVRPRPVVRRGKVLDAVLQEGSLTITVKAEVLEDGIPGQTVRARNLASKREFRARVENEQELLVSR